MITKNRNIESFLKAIKEVEKALLEIKFKQYSFEEKGYAYFIKFKRNNTIVEFLFGASDWEVEMIIFTTKGKFAFKDLLQIPQIAEWVNNNRYIQRGERIIKDELLWFVELLKFSLLIIE